MKYHVFLSFRGEDTRKTFTDHLYAALRRKGIVTFRDDEELERGQVISDKLMKAIEQSLFAIVVLSHDYASSSWCLEELHKIVESKQNLSGTIFPVFYGIDPSDIRHQRGNIGRAFKKHEEKVTQDDVGRWRKALTDVANLAGWDTRDKHEAVIIEDIVEVVRSKLCIKLPSNFDHLIGIQSKVDKIISLLKIGLDDKCFIGIWGMGGVGKTTLARVIYETIQNKFESSCFLANVREASEYMGLVNLQKKLLSCLQIGGQDFNDSNEGAKRIRQFLCRKKVFVVLDDVSHLNHLRNLAEKEEWFGRGSKIIITTRDVHLLTQYEQFENYNIELLNSDESLKLLCQYAFKMDAPQEGYMALSKEVVEYCGGLPLALQVLGSFLCKRSQSEWNDMLDKMKKHNLHKDILKILRISYDGLEDEEYKIIFLDVACFFNRKKEVEVARILENCGLHPTIGIKVLIEKSLLSYDGENLYMHDLLQDMGKNIILQESANDVGRCSRLWSEEKIDQVLNENNETRNIQGIVSIRSQTWPPMKVNWHPDCFSKMDSLRLLYLSDSHPSRSLNSLPVALKVLIWEKYSSKALPHNINRLHELVELSLRSNLIRRLWNGTPVLENLKLINLSESVFLTKTPDFSGVSNLESLDLEHCSRLVKIHESVGQLKKVVKLNLRYCTRLVSLPCKLEMDSLREFILRGCVRLRQLPEFGENMKSLSIFDMSGVRLRAASAIPKRRVWNSWRMFVPFSHLNSVEKLLKLPSSIWALTSLKELDLSDCNLCDGSIPEDLSSLSSLMSLDLSRNNFVNLPAHCISKLVNLKYFNVRNCLKLESMPDLPPNLIRIDATGSRSLVGVQHLLASHASKACNLPPHENEVLLLYVEGDEIPAWFEERELFSNSRVCRYDHRSVSINVDVPYVGEKSEWSGIAVCLYLVHHQSFTNWHCRRYSRIDWSFKALDDGGISRQIEGSYFEKSFSDTQLRILIFPFNTMECRPHQLDLEFKAERGGTVEIMGLGRHLMGKKDFDVCSSSSANSSLQITELHNDK